MYTNVKPQKGGDERIRTSGNPCRLHRFSRSARSSAPARLRAVGTGFEPARPFRDKGLANLRLRPLGHPTKSLDYTNMRVEIKQKSV